MENVEPKYFLMGFIVFAANWSSILPPDNNGGDHFLDIFLTKSPSLAFKEFLILYMGNYKEVVWDPGSGLVRLSWYYLPWKEDWGITNFPPRDIVQSWSQSHIHCFLRGFLFSSSLEYNSSSNFETILHLRSSAIYFRFLQLLNQFNYKYKVLFTQQNSSSIQNTHEITITISTVLPFPNFEELNQKLKMDMKKNANNNNNNIDSKYISL